MSPLKYSIYYYTTERIKILLFIVLILKILNYSDIMVLAKKIRLIRRVYTLKRIMLFVLIFTLFLSTTNTYAESINLNGEGAVLIDFDTGQVLYGKNQDAKLYPASTTKMMTAILAVENANLSDLVTVDQEVINLTKGSHIALEPGEVLTLEQLLYALMLPSANDAALAIAKHVSGSVEGFVNLMNAKAKELGAMNTNFVNPNGLHDDRHVSTAFDLALIARYAMNSEIIQEIVNTVTYEIPPTNKKTESRYFKVTNKLLFSNEKIDLNGRLTDIRYTQASGVKTGYTSQAMNCLASFAQEKSQKLIAVVLKAEGNMVYSDTHKLLNYGFDNFEPRILGYSNEFVNNVDIQKGEMPFVAGVLDRTITYPLSDESFNKVIMIPRIYQNVEAPIDKGQVIGEVVFKLDDKIIAGGNIISTSAVGIDTSTLLHNQLLSKWYLIVFALYFLLRVYALSQKKKRRRKRREVYRIPYTTK